MRKRKKTPPQSQALDLFGEVVVTLDDVDEWVRQTAPRWWRMPNQCLYVRMWNVVDKIKRAKLDGSFKYGSTEPPRPPCSMVDILRLAE